MTRRRLSSNVVSGDMATNALLGFLVLFVLAYLKMNPETKAEANLETEGKYVVILEWPDASLDDVDLYVMDPLGNTVYFRSRDVGLMHLENDDLGARSDTVQTGSGAVTVSRNIERVIIRGVVPGEYTVNVHMFRKEDQAATPATVSLYRLKGQDTEIVKRERVLERNGDEQTAFRFTLAADESVGGINELPRQIVTNSAYQPAAPAEGR